MIPHDQLYFEWLCSQIEIPSTFKKSFNGLFEKLHTTEFFWIITGDDNRISDAKDLRQEFLHKVDIMHSEKFREIKFQSFVSVLEIIIVVSRDLEFIASGQSSEWAWRLLENLKLNDYYDPLTRVKNLAVEEILDKFIWRTYEQNGQGGLFPLIDTIKDQRQIEIWYQLNEYVLEIVQR